MIIKYTSCDGITEVEEEIDNIQMDECVLGGVDIGCYRSENNQYGPGSLFSVPIRRVHSIEIDGYELTVKAVE